MKLPIRAKTLITVASLLLGFLLVSLLKAADADSSVKTEATLHSLINIEQENEQLEQDILKLQEELAKFQEGQNRSKVVLEQLDTAKRNAGLTQVTGQGIRVILDDSTERPDIDQIDASNYWIHEEYLRHIVNSLWHGKAEAIAINGERIMSHTEIFCSGAFIQINGRLYMPPYVIEAVGDVEYMQSALNFDIWYLLGEYEDIYGITRKLEVPTEPIVIPAGKAQQFRYAEPLKEVK